jgi:hypothetical protein
LHAIILNPVLRYRVNSIFTGMKCWTSERFHGLDFTRRVDRCRAVAIGAQVTLR